MVGQNGPKFLHSSGQSYFIVGDREGPYGGGGVPKFILKSKKKFKLKKGMQRVIHIRQP